MNTKTQDVDHLVNDLYTKRSAQLAMFATLLYMDFAQQFCLDPKIPMS